MSKVRIVFGTCVGSLGGVMLLANVPVTHLLQSLWTLNALQSQAITVALSVVLMFCGFFILVRAQKLHI
ncbi:MAG: hypothetical protein G01um101448_50 [Parcubacteria group bacterium Gr01-1014_48]|nr:MAG: hypothetical protein Greene041614_132 [Parcubacteria group bacterium Greene0416_14]TSC74531.1 MAG: hypothetical protein G01um101448_50 [Parcubacteria group bacterium Gr01-1014_48]TSD01407.1 MAG: hypothetical protein Greene101415_254 [Parcubacteria group bacterium Greene1014_15]TSD08451.1 MAG: hypothetical protein Greene07144_81 [Parcubacteria group bacterium Greene0714_4]